MTSQELEKAKEDLFNQRIENLRVEMTGKFDALTIKQETLINRIIATENSLGRIEAAITKLGNSEAVSKEKIRQLFVYAGFVNAGIVAVISTVIGWLFNK